METPELLRVTVTAIDALESSCMLMARGGDGFAMSASMRARSQAHHGPWKVAMASLSRGSTRSSA